MPESKKGTTRNNPQQTLDKEEVITSHDIGPKNVAESSSSFGKETAVNKECNLIPKKH